VLLILYFYPNIFVYLLPYSCSCRKCMELFWIWVCFKIRAWYCMHLWTHAPCPGELFKIMQEFLLLFSESTEYCTVLGHLVIGMQPSSLDELLGHSHFQLYLLVSIFKVRSCLRVKYKFYVINYVATIIAKTLWWSILKTN
jgi:hypothetical protein